MKLEDRQTTAATEVEARGPQGATASFASEDLDPGRERRPLESYFQEIGGTRTLRREEEVYLAKELEAATAALRGALYRIPCSSRHVVDRWDDLRALSHTGAKLSESMGDEAWSEVLGHHRRLVRACLRTHGGDEIGTQGDGFLVRHESPTGAVATAVAIQQAHATHRKGRDRLPAVRIRDQRDRDPFSLQQALHIGH